MSTKPKMLPGAITRLAEWRKRQQRETEERNSAMVALLASRVPKNLEVWLKYSGVALIRDLVEYRRATRKYAHEEGDLYDFKSLEEFETRLKQLNTAWSPVAKLDVYWDGSRRRFEVVFTAT